MLGRRPQNRILLAILLGATGIHSPSLARAAGFWEELRSPGIRAYRRARDEAARLLAERRFPEALAKTEEAMRYRSDQAEAVVLRGRALSGLGRHSDAIDAFARADRMDRAAVDRGDGREDWAVALARGSRFDEAAAQFRRLVALATLAASRARFKAALGLCLLQLGPDKIEDAIAAARDALLDDRNLLLARWALVLGLDRSRPARGSSGWTELEGARLELPEAGFTAGYAVLAPAFAAETRAIAALGAEWRSDREQGAALWERYIQAAGPNGVWIPWAREHVARLRADGSARGTKRSP